MIKILDIPKNAGSFSRFLNACFLGEKTMDAVILRDPYERFWSATKTVIDEISLFGGYPIDFQHQQRKTYQGLSFSVEDVINRSLLMLDDVNIDSHLKPQVDFIGNGKFDEVLIFENLNTQIIGMIQKYNIQTIENFSLDRKTNISPKERDQEAMNHILSSQSIKSKLDEFYKEDFIIYNTPELIKKAIYNPET